MSDPKDELGARFDERRPDEDAGSTNDQDDMSNTDNTGDTGSASNKPGPARDETATRHRQQVPMYLPDDKANALNELYERLDGRSKIAGDGGIEKHADFMETLVEVAIEHEDELAERLEIE